MSTHTHPTKIYLHLPPPTQNIPPLTPTHPKYTSNYSHPPINVPTPTHPKLYLNQHRSSHSHIKNVHTALVIQNLPFHSPHFTTPTYKKLSPTPYPPKIYLHAHQLTHNICPTIPRHP